MADLATRLLTRAAAEGLAVSPALCAKLLIYFELLQRWNRTINLTALSDPDEAIDRLLLEPVAAARYLPAGASLADLGSGGGSPAIPLALTLESPDLLMIDSRARKAAFLREAVREVGLTGRVETARFEDVAAQVTYSHAFDLVSIRAVSVDENTLVAADALLRSSSGVVALFRGPAGPERLELPTPVLTWRETRPLLRSSGSRLSVLFHVEHC